MDNKDLKRKEQQITLLVTTYYNKYEFLRGGNLNEIIKKALDRYLNSDLTIEEINDELMKIIIKRKKEYDARFDKEKVKENHKEIYSRLETLVGLLNSEGIDYQLAGALCSYLKYNQESDRVHDDIDLSMNEDDLEKFGVICEKLGLDYSDNRLDSPRVLKNGIPYGEHEVIAKAPDSDFHIGVFCFRRNKDESIDNRSYYKNDTGETCVWNEHLSPELSKLIFGREKIDFKGKELCITPLEYVYLLKKYTNNIKDKKDLEFMDGKIDMDKVEEIDLLNKTDRRVDLISIDSEFKDELNSMMKPEEESQKVTTDKLEKPKVFVKKDNNLDDKGYIHYSQIIIPFIIFVIIVFLIVLFVFISL